VTAWFAVVASLLLLQHPFLSYPVSLWFIAKFRRQPLGRGEVRPLSIDVVFCAYNEDKVIQRKLENCVELISKFPGLSAHCFSDGSSDRTPQIMADYQDRIDVVVGPGRSGKSVGMNTLLARCHSDIVIFTDANSYIDPASIKALEAYFADPNVGCVCGHLVHLNPNETATATASTKYWDFEQVIKGLESLQGYAMGADGALFAIRRKLFSPVPSDIIDDMFTSMSIMCSGYRLVQADDFVATERSVTTNSEEFRRKVRIACRAFNCHRLLWPKIRKLPLLARYMYVSHKLLRWFSGLWILVFAFALFFALAQISYVSALIYALLGVCFCLLGRANLLGKANVLWTATLSFFATSLGVWKSMRGERFATWAIASSAR